MTLPSRADASGIVVLDERAPARAGGVRFAGASHPGLVRERNEDRLHIDAERGVLLVVDGMGGAAAGEVAAETALARVVERLERRGGTAEDRVREAIASANNEIARLAGENPAWEGMGCVLTLVLLERGMATVGHVGDSRLYRVQAGRLEKITHDHSPVGVREDGGELSERDAMRHPRRSEVYRSLGSSLRGPRDPDFIEVLRVPFAREDALLVCSDGLTDLVPAGEIARVVRESAGDERTLVQRLVDVANAAGGKDNVTVAFAAGDRFASSFGVAGGGANRERVPRPSRRAEAPSRRATWSGRATFFALGALVGIGLAGAYQFLGHPERTAALAPTDAPPAPAPTRHAVGPGRAFHTIGDALAAARAGDTVVVDPGRYHEQVRLEDGVTLLAAVPGRVVIEPRPPGDGSGPVAALVAEDVGAGRVSGLVIAPAPGAPIDYGLVIRRAAVSVENMEIRGARVAGVAIEDAGGAALLASHVHDNPGAGIVIRGPGAPAVLDNRVIGNGRGGPPAPGIEVERGARPRIAGNVIAGNGAQGVRGMASRALLENNLFEAFGRANGMGAASAARPRGAR